MDRIAYLQTIIEEDPETPFPYFALAKEFEKKSDFSAAKSNYEYLRHHHPKYVGTYYHLGKLMEKLDHLDEALAVYEQGIIVAEEQNDLHSRSELQGAKDMLTI
ncbi:MAG: tetratricopeptide repeat protein [Saprospiraceae bacterium]|nr:tetratricopeptide repeat protein [Saprospiraceae bacterium]